MHTPRPYSESRKGNTILREFSADVDSDDLIWHQDRADRRVTVVEGSGWRLQMQDGLPFTLIEGNTYDIPARTWHRLIRGQGDLRVKILENKMRITESQLRRIVREEAKRLLESSMDLEKDTTTRSWLRQFKLNPRDKELHRDLASAWDMMCEMAPSLTFSPTANKMQIVDRISEATGLARGLISFHLQGVKRLVDSGNCPSGDDFLSSLASFTPPTPTPQPTGPDIYSAKYGQKARASVKEPWSRGIKLFDTAEDALGSLYSSSMGPDSWSVFKDPNTGKYWATGDYDTSGT